MKRFSPRQQNIINIIANSNGPIIGKTISFKLNISLRTVQSEIKTINNILPLIISSNIGYQINADNFKTLDKNFNEAVSFEHQILRKLIHAQTPYNLGELSDEFYISESYLVKIIKSFNELLNSHDLKIAIDHNCIQIIGKETNRRQLINQLIFDEVNPSLNQYDQIDVYFPDLNTTKINEILLRSISNHDCHIEKAYLPNLIINIAITLYRRQKGDDINNELLNNELGQTFVAISKELFKELKITHSHNDVLQVAMLFIGLVKPNQISSNYELNDDFVKEIRSVVDKVFKYYNLQIDYSKALRNFATHIDAMLKRIVNGQPANNEILFTIKNTSPFIHDLAVNIAQGLEDLYQISIPDNEIGYLSIHIGQLIELSKEVKHKVAVLLIAEHYNNIDIAIKNKLLDQLGNFITLTNLNDHPNVIPEGTDLVITTHKNPIPGYQTIVISPFYNEEDYFKIDEVVHTQYQKKNQNYYNRLIVNLFHENLFFINSELKHKDDVINFMADQIHDFGIVDQNFKASVFKRESLSSTCFLDSFAIPHAIELNAKQTKIAVLINPQGIDWDGHLIHLVLMITINIKDRKMFSEIYEGIVKILSNPAKLEKLISAESLDSFINLLQVL